MSKKVAIIYAGAKYWGGIETYIKNLFEYNNNDKIELHFISIGEWDLGKKIPNTKYQIPNKWYKISNLKLILNYLDKNNIDLVVSQGMVGTFYARIVSIFTKISNIIIFHSDWKYDYEGFKKLLFWIVDRLLRSKTSRYIAVSKYLKSLLIEEGVPADKIEVIYNGIELNKKIEIKNQKEKLKDKNLITGSIGRLHPVKNYENLIKAMAILKNNNWQLEIIGDGPEYKKLEDLIKKLSLEKNIQLIGYQKEIDKFYEKWDVYIQPSKSEGFGLTVIEAMLAGLPVIVSPCGSLKELVHDSETGIVTSGVEPIMIADSVIKALNGKYNLSEISKKGQKYARDNFSIKEWIEKTENIFLEAIK